MQRRNPFLSAIGVLLVVAALWFARERGWLDQPSQGGDAQIAQPEQRPPPVTPVSDNKAPPRHPVPKGDFDYYVLALSWSPTYCETEATERDRMQCGKGRAHGFIVHGLWPQNERGYPEECPTSQPRVLDALVDEMLDIMPSRGLIGHEWRTHGACTGLSQEDYFAAVRAAWEAVRIPAALASPARDQSLSARELATLFLQANDMLKPDALVMRCNGDQLDEVRLCMDKQFRFMACGQQMSRGSCRRERVNVPAPVAEQ